MLLLNLSLYFKPVNKMKKILFLSAVVLSLGFNESMAQAPVTTTYGAASTATSALSPLRVQGLLQNQQQVDNIQFAGYIAEVASNGTWIKLKSSATAQDVLMVKVKNNAFTIPANAVNKTAKATGDLKKIGTGSNVTYEMHITGVDVLQ